MRTANPIAFIDMSNGAQIVIELFPEVAPNTVNSFIHLARMGVFDNYRIARVEPGYVVDVSTNAYGRAESRYLIENEAGSARDGPRAELGTVAMGGYDGHISGGEFFFPLARHEKIDGKYPCFGRVIHGLEEILRIGGGPVRRFGYCHNPDNVMHRPLRDEVIRQVRVETHGRHYPEPRKLDAPLPEHWFMEDYDDLL